MTTSNFSINPISITINDLELVKEFKYKYIDYIMHNGIYYNVCGFISACLNKMIEHMNKPEVLNFEVGGYEAHSCDLVNLRKHADIFLNVFKSQVPEDVYLHVKDVLTRSIDELEKMTILAKEQREKEIPST